MKRLMLSLGLVALLAAAAPATAKRAPTGAEKRAISAAVEDYVHASGSPAAHDNRVKRIRVSSRNDRWARANVVSKSAGPAMAAVKERRNGTWRVVSFGSAMVQCDVRMPKAVQKELFGGDDCPPGER